MALHNPTGLYQGEAPLNPMPYVNIALQARARKQAREDAIDKYYRALPDTLNDKNIRDQEIPVINEYKNKIFEFGLKNKEALRNPKMDNGAAQFQLNKLMKEAQGIARESQNAAKTDLELGKLWFNKENQWALSNDDFIKQHEAHNRTVIDPNYKKMDLATVMAQRPFDQTAFVKQLKTQFPYSEKVARTKDPENPLYDIVTTKPELDKKTKLGIYDFAADKLHNDYTFRNKIQKELVGTGQLPRLQEISQEVFGKPIESDEDLAAAYTVSQMYSPPTKEKSQINTEAVMDKRFKQQKIMEGIRQANRKELFGMREAAKEAGEEANDLWIDNYINKTKEEAKASGKTQTYKFANGTVVKGYPVEVDPVMSKALGFNEKNPGKLMVTEDGKFIPMFFKTNENYEPISKDGSFAIDPAKTNVLTQDAIKLALGGKTGVKQLNKEMTKPSSPTKKITVKKGELDDL